MESPTAYGESASEVVREGGVCGGGWEVGGDPFVRDPEDGYIEPKNDGIGHRGLSGQLIRALAPFGLVEGFKFDGALFRKRPL